MATSTTDLIAAELTRHVDLILFTDETRYGVTLQKDTGGLRCSCGEWSAPPVEPTGTRPNDQFREHVARAIITRITTPDVMSDSEPTAEKQARDEAKERGYQAVRDSGVLRDSAFFNAAIWRAVNAALAAALHPRGEG